MSAAPKFTLPREPLAKYGPWRVIDQDREGSPDIRGQRELGNNRFIVATVDNIGELVAVATFTYRPWADACAAAPELYGALGALGVIGGGYCFCSQDRDPDKSVHQPECADARAALAKVSP